MTITTHPISTLTSTDEYVLDPRKSLPDYRREIYDLLQYLDEEQDKIEKQLARFSPSSKRAGSKTRRPSISSSKHVESEDEDDFVVVEDINAGNRKKQLLSQLQQLWRTRDALRKRAKQLNIKIDSLDHGKRAGLMPRDELLENGVDVGGYEDGDEF